MEWLRTVKAAAAYGSVTAGRTPHFSRRLSGRHSRLVRGRGVSPGYTPVPGDNGTLMELDTRGKGRKEEQGEEKEEENRLSVS